MTALAMWLQDTSTAGGGLSAGTEKWIIIFLGLIAFSMLVQAIVYIAAGVVAMKLAKEAMGAVAEVRKDLKTSTEEIKAKVYPLVDGIMHAGKTAQGILDDAVPKVKLVTDHLVDTSKTLKDTAEKLGQTVSDANQKTQRQVARVDSMVTAALDTTAELVATIEHGIKVPAQKIAVAAGQVRSVAEGILDRIKGVAAGLPFMQGKSRPAGSTAGVPPRRPVPTATTPPSATGAVPLVK